MTYEEFCKKHNVTVSACGGSLTRPDNGYRDSTWNSKATHHMITLSAGDRIIWSGWYSLGFGFALDWATRNTSKFQVRSSCWHALEDMRRGKKSKFGEFKQWFTDEVRKTAIPHMKPAAHDVLEGVAMDASGSDQCFEDWASDLGYDTDSRSAYRIWEECNTTRRTLRDGLGEELFSELMECEE